MLRILLVVDDYGELLFLQTLLKKLGFDVDGIQNERSFEDSFLALNPDVVIASAKGKKVDGLELSENMRKVRGLPKVILLAGGPLLDRLQTLQLVNVDGLLESPVSSMRLLAMIAAKCGLDQAVLLEKYRKLKATLSPEREADLQILRRDEEGELSLDTAPLPQAQEVVTQASPSTLSIQQRQQRFQKTLSQIDKPQSERFERSRIQQFTKEIRAGEDVKENIKLEEERQAFVRALFKKARN